MDGTRPPFALELEQLSKVFGDRRAVDDISLQLPQGSFLSIFGPNGAGKTTLLRMLATLSRPSSGMMRVQGVDAIAEPDKARAHIGLIGHQPMLYADLGAEENLLSVARLYGIRNAQERVDELLEAVELSHRRFDAVRTFSRGMTQRLAIARALLHNPGILLLDEPYSGLDPHAVDIFDELLASVREDRTFVMVSHNLHRGLAACTHVLVMAKGRSVAYQEVEGIDRVSFEQLYRDTVGAGVA